MYTTYFKSSVPHLSKCPHCGFAGEGASKYSKFNAISRALSQLSSMGYTLLVNREEVTDIKAYYPVRCNICGCEFSTTLINNHFNKCPYCNESHSQFNQQSKIEKICAEYDYTFMDTYKGQYSNGHFAQYKVKCNKCGTLFETFINGKQLKLCPHCKPSEYRSSRERKISTLLDVLGIEHFNNYKINLDGTHAQEIDIYIPSLKIGFEFNGYYWHNSGIYEHSKPKDYHAQKTKNALSKGIKLYHIWENTSDDLVYSIVRSKIGKSLRVYARRCSVVELSSTVGKEFFDRCHVDGNVRATKYFALVQNSQVMCCLSLNQRRIQSSGQLQWEIARFASELNINVVGGYSKLLKHAVSFLKQLNVRQLVSYCNRDLSPDPNSTVYSKLGFNFVMDSGPIYKYWCSCSVEYNGKLYERNTLTGRQTLQHKKLLEHYDRYNIPLPKDSSEFGLATELGFMPCYNSGNFKYVLEL